VNLKFLPLLLLSAGCSNELQRQDASYTLYEFVKSDYCKNQGDKVNGCVTPVLSKSTSLVITTATQRHIGGRVIYKADIGRPCWDDVTGTFNKTTGGVWVLSSVSGWPHCEGVNEMILMWQTPNSFEWPIVPG